MTKSLLENEEADKAPAYSHLSRRLNSQNCSGFPHLTSRLPSAGAWLSSLSLHPRPCTQSHSPPYSAAGRRNIREHKGPAGMRRTTSLTPLLTALNCQNHRVITPAPPPTSLTMLSHLLNPQLCSARQGLGPHSACTGPSINKRIKLYTLTAQL